MEKVRQYPYFLRLFHTSTPLRSVELRMKKESMDLVASTGHLCKQESLQWSPGCISEVMRCTFHFPTTQLSGHNLSTHTSCKTHFSTHIMSTGHD